MANNTRLLKNLLTTASIITLVNMSSSAFATERKTLGAEVQTSVNTDFDPNGTVVNNDSIKVDPTTETNKIIFNNNSIGDLTKIGSLNFSVSTIDVDVEVNQDLTLGVVVSTSAENSEFGFNFKMADTKKLTLSGEKGVFRDSIINKYTRLKSFDFSAGSSELIVQAADNGLISLSTKFINPNRGALTVKTDMIATDESVGDIKLITIDDGKLLQITPINSATVNISGNAIGTGDAGIKLNNTSRLRLGSTGGAQNEFILKNKFDPGAPDGGIDGNAGRGIIELSAAGKDDGGKNSQSLLKVDDANIGKNLGTGDNPIRLLKIVGDGQVVIDRGVQVKAVDLNISKDSILLARDKSLLENIADKINIGEDTGAGEYIFDGGQIVKANGITVATLARGPGALPNPGEGDTTITVSAAKFKFNHADSEVSFGGIFKTKDTLTFELDGDIAAIAGNGGIINLGTALSATQGSEDDSNVVLTSDDNTAPARKLGDSGGNKIKKLNISATDKAPVTVTYLIDLSGVLETNIERGQFIAQTTTIGKVPTINIGTKKDDGTGIAAEDGILTIDASFDNMKLLENAQSINFNTKDSRLKFTHDNNTYDSNIKIYQNLAPTAGIVAGDDGVGIVEFKSAGTGKNLELTSDGGNKAVGTSPLKRVNKFIVSGVEEGEVDVEVYAKSILIGEVGNNKAYIADPATGALVSGDVIGETIFKKAVNGGEFIFNNPGKIIFQENSDIGDLDFKGFKNAAIASIGIDDDKTLAIGGNSDKEIILNDQFYFGNENSTLAISNKTDLKSTKKITLEEILRVNTPGEGIINLSASLTKDGSEKNTLLIDGKAIGDADGKFKTIRVSGAGNVVSNVDFYANDIIFRDANFGIGKDVKITATMIATELVLDVGSNSMTYTGDAVFANNNTIKTAFTGGKGGNVTLDATSTVDFSRSTLKILFSSPDDSATPTTSYDVLKIVGTARIINKPANASFTVVDNKNRTIEWVLDGFTIKAVNKVPERIDDDLAETDPQLGGALGDAYTRAQQKLAKGMSLTDFEQESIYFAKIANSSADKLVEAAKRQEKDATVSQAIANINAESVDTGTRAVLSVINSRINVNNINNLSEANGVAAGGDESLRHGIWGSPFYNQSVQKKKGTTPGYKTKAIGGTIGFDTMLNDNLTAGIAFTTFRTNVDQKDQKKGDYAKIDTNMVSIYALNELPNNFYVQGTAFFGTSTIKNNEKRILDLTNYQIATSKYESNSWGGEALGGYNYKVRDNAILSLQGGLGYITFNDNGYKETGTTFQNFKVNKKSTNKLKAIIGVRGAIETNLADLSVRSELYGNLNYDLTSKTPKIEATQDGNPNMIKSNASRPTRAFYTIGADVGTSYRMMDYGIGYGLTLAKKYVGQNVTARVKVNF